MYLVQDSHSFWNWIYFVILVVVCACLSLGLGNGQLHCKCEQVIQIGIRKRRPVSELVPAASRALFLKNSYDRISVSMCEAVWMLREYNWFFVVILMSCIVWYYLHFKQLSMLQKVALVI